MNERNKTANNWTVSPRRATLPASLGVSELDKTDALFYSKPKSVFKNIQIEQNPKKS